MRPPNRLAPGVLGVRAPRDGVPSLPPPTLEAPGVLGVRLGVATGVRLPDELRWETDLPPSPPWCGAPPLWSMAPDAQGGTSGAIRAPGQDLSTRGRSTCWVWRPRQLPGGHTCKGKVVCSSSRLPRSESSLGYIRCGTVVLRPGP